MDSDLPRKPDGTLEEKRFALGKGIPKMNRRDVHTGDAVMKEGHGVGGMYTPIKRGVMKAVGKPGEGTSASVIMVDQTTGQKYLFKPTGGDPTFDFAEARGVAAGHYAERARAGQLAAGALGVATPDVRLVSINGRKGSLTTWIEPKDGGQVMTLDKFRENHYAEFVVMKESKAFKDALGGIQALDYMINNLDRVNNTANYMIELDEHKQFKALIPIDQELSFTHTGDRAIIPKKTEFFPEHWTPALAEKVAKLKENPSELIAKIRPLVGDAAVAGVLARLDQLHQDGVRRGAIVPRGGPGAPGPAGGSASSGQHPALVGGSETPVATDSAPVRSNAKVPGSPAVAKGADATPAGPSPAAPGAPVAAPPLPAKPATGTGPVKSRKGDINVTKDSPGVKGEYMFNNETTEGDSTTTKGRGATGSIGGGNIAQVGGQQVESVKTGDDTTTNKKAANLTLKPDGTFVLGSEKSKATYRGTDAQGDPKKTGENKTNKSFGYGDKGFVAGAGAERETAGGHKIGASGTATFDGKGNASFEGQVKFESKGGTSLTPSVSGSTTVEASDPIPAEGGGFDVTFKVTDTSGVGFGASKQVGGGPAVGFQMGSSSGTLNTGSRHFDSEEKAKAFRDKAATVIAAEALHAHPPITTIDGALAIPLGEERGTGDVEGSSWGASASMEGATASYSSSKSTTHEFKVRHTHDKVIQVTGSVVGTKASEFGLSGGIALGRGGSNYHGFEVVWEIDLADKGGRDSFEMYAKTGMPPLHATFISMTSSKGEEDHDSVTIPLLGTAKWTGATWEIIREDAKGRHFQSGGKQSHDQDPSRFGKFLGQDTIHSNSQITSKLDTDKSGNQEESYEAQITVSGSTGDETRRELGQIWMGVPHDGPAKASGEWTLSSQVSAKVVGELEAVNEDMKKAVTKEDKMRVYSRLVKERGIRMVGAQVGLGGDPLAWNVELKGDKNFPGPNGRAALDGKRNELRGKLKDPKAAKSIVSEAQATIDLLNARRIAVSDKKQYTDLPDGLREQQVRMIDKHISDFELVRHAALKAALKGDTPAKPEPAKAGAKPGAAGGAAKGGTEAAQVDDLAGLRTKIGEKSDAISSVDAKNDRAIKAVMAANDRIVKVHPVYGGWVTSHFATYKSHWDIGISINERQSPMGPLIDAKRQRLIEAIFHVDQKTAAEELLKLVTDRLALLEALHTEVIAAAEALKPIITEKALSLRPNFWGSIKGDPAPWTDEGVGTNED